VTSIQPLRRSAIIIGLLSLMAPGLTGCFAPTASTSTKDRISLVMLQPPRSALSPLSDDAFKLSRWSTAETLTVLDDTAEARPSLATSWERTGEKVWRFHIRTGVTFHDGTPLTAEWVANSLTEASKASPLPRILNGVNLQMKVEGDTVVAETASPDPLLPQRFSSPQLSILSPASYKGSVVDPVGHGTGPFKLTSVNGTTGATLDRYEGYWGKRAEAPGIDVRFVPDGTARAAALRTGDADIVEAIPAGQAPNLDKGLVHEVPMPRTNTLYLNTKSGPFADPAVRAAAREALDRAALISSVYEGRADTAQGLLGPALSWAAPFRTTQPYRDLLAKRAPAAKVSNVKISLGTFTDRAELPEVAVVIEQQLKAAGFVVTQDVREYQYIEADALAGKFDAFVLSRATVLDSGDPVAYFASDFGCKGGFNISQFCSADIDQAIATAATTDAGEKRREAIMLAEARILATDAAIPLLHERVIQGESTRIRDAARDARERQVVTASTRINA
jgi:peptide/nickel transport system substrate-binding protein